MNSILTWSLILLIVPTHALKILVFSPIFGASHSNFMGHIADTYTEAGHNVTYLVPVVDPSRLHQIGTKITKNVILLKPNDATSTTIESSKPDLSHLWTDPTYPAAISKSFKAFHETFRITCDNFLGNKSIIEEMRSVGFDIAIAEPLSVCGLAFFHHIGINKVILTSSHTLLDPVPIAIGEPLPASFVPSIGSNYNEKMSLYERLDNLRTMKVYSDFIYGAMEKEMLLYKHHFGDEMPHFKELLAGASFRFTNTNPFFDFPRPVIQKTVFIGGITIDKRNILSKKLPKEWDDILNLRPENVLISFGSITLSSQMPEKAKNCLLNIIKSMPDVTFIWKYESENVDFAKDVPNIYFSKWVPQTALLADPRLSVFVTHGGLGSTNELAHLGKPAVTIPMFGDQMRNAHMLARHGGAEVVNKFDLDKEDVVRKALQNVLYDDRYRQNAQKLAEILENQPLKPKDLVLKYTEFTARFGPFPQLDPHGRKLNFIQYYFLDAIAIALITLIALIILGIVLLRKLSKFITGSSHINKKEKQT